MERTIESSLNYDEVFFALAIYLGARHPAARRPAVRASRALARDDVSKGSFLAGVQKCQNHPREGSGRKLTPQSTNALVTVKQHLNVLCFTITAFGITSIQ